MDSQLIETHYRNNYTKLIKRMTFRVGTVWAAEDVVQTAYERAIRYFRPLPYEDFEKWFSTILNNAVRDYQAAERGYCPIVADDELQEELSHNECPHYAEEVMREIFELIDTKSVVQIEVLSLHFKHGLSARDISIVTNYSYAKTHQVIQRFRNELKDIYG